MTRRPARRAIARPARERRHQRGPRDGRTGQSRRLAAV